MVHVYVCVFLLVLLLDKIWPRKQQQNSSRTCTFCYRLNEASFFSTNESVITTVTQRYFTIELLNQQENNNMVKAEHYFKLQQQH